MRPNVFLILGLLCGGVAFGLSTQSSWKRMQRELVGNWAAKTSDGKKITTSYKLVSRDSSLLELYRMPNGRETITVYYPDGGSILLTHYCAQGNQARLRIAETSAGGAKFRYLDATNLEKDQAVLSELAFNFGQDKFDQTSIYRLPDGREETTTLHFVRIP